MSLLVKNIKGKQILIMAKFNISLKRLIDIFLSVLRNNNKKNEQENAPSYFT